MTDLKKTTHRLGYITYNKCAYDSSRVEYI